MEVKDSDKEALIRHAYGRFDEAVRWVAEDIAGEAAERLEEQGVLDDVPEAEINPVGQYIALTTEEIYYDVAWALATEQLSLEWWRLQVTKKVIEYRASKPGLEAANLRLVDK